MDGGLPSDHDAILLRADAGGVRTLTMNRPRARNALSMELMAALIAALAEAAADPDVRVIVLAAAGPVFCAGHDLRQIMADRDEATCRTLFATCGRLMTAIVRLAKPVIAQVQGVATAAGCQLVAACDLAVAGEAARFATPGVSIGLFCSTPMVALSRAVGRKAAMEMLLTGEMVAADEARRLGLVNRVVPDAALAEQTAALAARIAARSPLTIALGKQAFHRQIEMTLEDAHAYTAEVMTQNMMSHDAAEGIDAFLSHRDPVWSGT
jgi:enoyl-CoA hydratase/carnithine racemase